MDLKQQLVTALASVVLTVPISVAEQSTAVGDAGASVTLLYIADVHGHMEPHPESFWRGKQTEIASSGGLARVAAVVESIRRERPGRVIFMDAGDIIQGSGAAALAEEPAERFGGWVPRPSGMSVRFKAHSPKGERVSEIRVGGEPVEEERSYWSGRPRQSAQPSGQVSS